MPTSNEKIVAGVAARGGHSDSSLAKFARGPKTLAELTEVAARSSLALERLRKIIALRDGEIAQRSAEIRREWNARTELGRDMREAMAEKEIAAYRRNVLTTTEQDRSAVLSELRGFEAEVGAVAALWESPAHLLMREGLGSEERSRYLGQMQYAGPAEVSNLAAFAVSTGNRVLGAAVLSKLDSMSPENRKLAGVSRQDLAQVLTGGDHERARESILVARNRVQEGVNINRAFEAAKPRGGLDRIKLALSKRGETGILEDPGERA